MDSGPRFLADDIKCVFRDWKISVQNLFFFALQGKPGKDGDPGSAGFPVSFASSLMLL